MTGSVAPGAEVPELTKFRIITTLGGLCWRARRLGREDIVAVKVVPPGRRGASREHLNDCVSRARELDHPNVVRALDVVEDIGLIVVVSEYVEGDPLGRVLQRNVRMQPAAVLAILDAVGAPDDKR